MIIEFADPGYNFGLMWWGIGLTVLGIVLFWLPFFLTGDERKIAGWPLIGFIIAFCAPLIFFPWAATDYSKRVVLEQAKALQELGFSNEQLSGDRFTAATEDGQFFSGILVDLEPDSGYAYQVLEITPTK